MSVSPISSSRSERIMQSNFTTPNTLKQDQAFFPVKPLSSQTKREIDDQVYESSKEFHQNERALKERNASGFTSTSTHLA